MVSRKAAFSGYTFHTDIAPGNKILNLPESDPQKQAYNSLPDGHPWKNPNMYEHGATIGAYSSAGEKVGEMELSHQGHVNNVEVAPEHQRRGVATGMWNHAKKEGLNPKHSSLMTDEGSAWAMKVGD